MNSKILMVLSALLAAGQALAADAPKPAQTNGKPGGKHE